MKIILMILPLLISITTLAADKTKNRSPASPSDAAYGYLCTSDNPNEVAFAFTDAPNPVFKTKYCALPVDANKEIYDLSCYSSVNDFAKTNGGDLALSFGIPGGSGAWLYYQLNLTADFPRLNSFPVKLRVISRAPKDLSQAISPKDAKNFNCVKTVKSANK